MFREIHWRDQKQRKSACHQQTWQRVDRSKQPRATQAVLTLVQPGLPRLFKQEDLFNQGDTN